MPTERRKHWLSPCPACGNRLLLFSACTVRDGLLTKTYLCAGKCAAVFVLKEPLGHAARAGNDNGQGRWQGQQAMPQGRQRERLLASVNVW